MKFTMPMLLLAVSLSACAVAQDPVVTSYNGDSVNIIQPAFSTSDAVKLQAAADDICSRGHKKFAERVSARVLPDYQGTEYLFLCLAKKR